MNGTASFTLDRDYFETYHEDWLRNVRPWKRWLLPAVIALSIAGVGVLVLAPTFRLTGLVMIGIGVFETFNTLSGKSRWLRHVRATPAYGSTVVMEFTDDALYVRSSISESRFEWAMFPKWHQTPTGLFLCPQTGSSIYLPDTALKPPAAKAAILERLDQADREKRSANQPA